MMMSNLDLWNKVNKPPPSALKTIQAGRLKGMSDINPQWRLQVMTENFGQIGVGWYYDIVEMWTEDGAGGELMAFVQINLFTCHDGVWSKPIAGVGGSALVAKESSGLRANDEGYKMATTDALSVAMKQLGVASAIYEGRWDGSKYKDDPAPIKQSPAPNLLPPPLSQDEIALCITAMNGCTEYEALKGIFGGAFKRCNDLQKKTLTDVYNAKKLLLEKAA